MRTESRREKGNVQSVFDELLAMTGPKPPERYRGFPTERYVSYAVKSSPLDDLRDISTPVFLAQGTRDLSVPVESADLMAVELLRNPTRQMKYLILDGLDHGYFTSDAESHQTEVFEALLSWAACKPRGVETRLYQAK